MTFKTTWNEAGSSQKDAKTVIVKSNTLAEESKWALNTLKGLLQRDLEFTTLGEPQ